MRPRKTPAGEIRRGREVPKSLEFFEEIGVHLEGFMAGNDWQDMGDENYVWMKNIKSILSYDFY